MHVRAARFFLQFFFCGVCANAGKHSMLPHLIKFVCGAGLPGCFSLSLGLMLLWSRHRFAAPATDQVAGMLSQFLPWLAEDLGNFVLFLEQATTTPAAMTVAADILWAAAVFSAYVLVQAVRTRTWRLLWAVLLTWTVGLSCGLPLYFALRD